MKKMVGFGDYLLRLNPEGYLRFIQADHFQINYTGAEANVCVSLAMMGIDTEFVTRLPDNDIAACGVAGAAQVQCGDQPYRLRRGADGCVLCGEGGIPTPLQDRL